MSFVVQEYVKMPRDSARERALARQLRQLPEQERFTVVLELLSHHLFLGLAMATACLQKPLYFERLLEMALHVSDASSIQWWLECVVPKMGFRRVAAFLLRYLPEDWNAVEQALYFLPNFLPPGDERAAEALSELKTAIGPRKEAAVMAYD